MELIQILSSLERPLAKVSSMQDWQQLTKNYSIGAFGLVKVGWLRSDPANKYAIKSMKKHEIIESKHVDHIENEKLILSKMDHPFSVSHTPSFHH